MLLSISDSVRKLWERWNLRGLIIISLSLQAFLIMFASSRKRRGGWKIVMLIWSAYLLADWVATVAIGLISSGLGLTLSSQANTSTLRESNDILAFWAPFLLLHLGGPDTITSFALEDNELWVRHMLGLALQVLSTVYVFLQSLPKNILWLPSGFVFIAGIIKYAERTRALYLASLNHFGESACRKPNPGPEYQRIQMIYSSIQQANLPARTLIIKRPEIFESMEYLEEQNREDDSRSILRFAFEFFDTFKGLIAGLLLSPQERHVSREFFLNRNPNSVFQIIEIELSILYEVLHTKVQVVRCKTGYIFRSVSFGCILGAFFSFFFVKKHSFRMFDIRLSYSLLIGAMVLDFISLIFVILSDWTVRGQYWDKGAANIASRVINRRRWSKSVSQYNFFTYCLNDYPEWINKLAEALHLRSILEAINGMRHRFSKKFRKNQEWHFIFKELWKKSRTATTVEQGKKICLQRGDGILSERENEHLKWSIQDFNYTESLLLWHIATELCYEDKAKLEICDENKAEDGPSSENIDYKAICKLLSDYMFYLLMMQPTMMAPVSGDWKLVFQDTCAETKRFLSEHSVSTTEEACKEIHEAEAEIRPRALRGGESKSVLFDARILTGEIKKLNGNRWELMSKVWVELMSYAAINCRAYVHAQQPSNGGELLTFVWLLMNHLGLGTQVSEDEAVRLKFVVGK
ncbi:hypothetical protein SLEP1_g9203 [Rubroshorea leprosula]|uniref:DUF4220 domain-containing protein n=1 Tax=Rubroshorea leprosula TaxID=152421 RepID=A0AAV5IF65_9ROSI|nr:hypothetical protein SLEP1_g9203 [Rubroshorea leprosula]